MTDAYRLPTHVLPRAYRLRLSPDLGAFTFDGEVEIDVDVTAPTSTIVLSAHELELEPPELRPDGGAPLLGTVTLDAENQRADISFTEEVPAGTYVLSIRFRGILNDQLAGFYRSTYTDDDGADHTIATTQFEMADARRAFPCFDEPAFKATFDVTLVVPAGLAAFSNSPVQSSRELADGRREVTFGPTMRMSTYLVAFVVGPFVQTDPVDVDGVPLTVVSRPSQAHLTPFALEVGAFALRFFKEYFGIPYPGDKVDLVGIPDFAFGAMENVGCVTFREAELLVDADTASQNELVRIAMVIAHELAHMWFGDLVTMAWWEGLWLNEAFATLMQFLCVDAYRPEWKMWVRFAGERELGLMLDALHATRPIEFPVHTPADAVAMADPITYQKGSSVLRMLEHYLTPEVFREGVRHYLRTHSYGNTVTSDLWQAFEDVSGRPVGEVMSTWILQGGHPIVAVGDGTLSQRPFMLTPRTEGSRIGERWQVPIVARPLDGGGAVSQLLVDERGVLECAQPAVVNAGGTGVYRTSYGPAQLAPLAERLGELDENERFALVADTWALVRAGERSVADVLGLADRLGTAVEPGAWETVDEVLDFLSRLVTDAERPRLAERVRRLMGPVFAPLGWDPRPGDDERAKVLRATLVRRLGTTGEDTEIQKEAVRRFDAGALEGDLAQSIVAVVASLNRPGDYEEMVRRFQSAKDPQTEVRYQAGIASFTDESICERAFDEVFDTFRLQDAPMVIFRLVSNRVGGLSVWSKIAERWDATIERIPGPLQAVVGVGLLPQLADAELVAKIAAFHAAHPVAMGQPLVDQAIERLASSSRMADRERPSLAATLA